VRFLKSDCYDPFPNSSRPLKDGIVLLNAETAAGKRVTEVGHQVHYVVVNTDRLKGKVLS